ncbi:hypothetical protein ES332_A07G251500v1 [Gossypium tomentosum]|uniref:Uncharacterized protein n=1 Tax=Gossypium tomentosum TaxID=34277 RepID=A0A5D2PZH2_GOSTO|nr:hypothetical protein ES332_A07G251500v1 [Gossypium tomentosum]
MREVFGQNLKENKIRENTPLFSLFSRLGFQKPILRRRHAYRSREESFSLPLLGLISVTERGSLATRPRGISGDVNGQTHARRRAAAKAEGGMWRLKLARARVAEMFCVVGLGFLDF